jgi:hypothetical protein
MKAPLTKEEKARIPFVLNLIKKSDGYISGRQICNLINKHKPMADAKMTDARLRKMLHYARMSSTTKRGAIIASSFGYKYTTDKSEMSTYVLSLVERADKIMDLAKKVKSCL